MLLLYVFIALLVYRSEIDSLRGAYRRSAVSTFSSEP
jgi:hypothetical protein